VLSAHGPRSWPVNTGSVDKAPMFMGGVRVRLTNKKISTIFRSSQLWTQV